MSHNVDLPTHRYVHVIESAVHRDGSKDKTIPCVWYGVSSTPGRMYGCHVLLESGAMVVDLPLHALRHRPDAVQRWCFDEAQRWDAFGWDIEVSEPKYLSGLMARVLDRDHREVEHYGDLWFCIDHIKDGYSQEPAQHKHQWVVALDTGVFICVPQDQLLVAEQSFTEYGAIPPIRRQTRVWSCE
jgi:hypothetical protein